jgi:hypothetical protein
MESKPYRLEVFSAVTIGIIELFRLRVFPSNTWEFTGGYLSTSKIPEATIITGIM